MKFTINTILYLLCASVVTGQCANAADNTAKIEMQKKHADICELLDFCQIIVNHASHMIEEQSPSTDPVNEMLNIAQGNRQPAKYQNAINYLQNFINEGFDLENNGKFVKFGTQLQTIDFKQYTNNDDILRELKNLYGDMLIYYIRSAKLMCLIAQNNTPKQSFFKRLFSSQKQDPQTIQDIQECLDLLNKLEKKLQEEMIANQSNNDDSNKSFSLSGELLKDHVLIPFTDFNTNQQNEIKQDATDTVIQDNNETEDKLHGKMLVDEKKNNDNDCSLTLPGEPVIPNSVSNIVDLDKILQIESKPQDTIDANQIPTQDSPRESENTENYVDMPHMTDVETNDVTILESINTTSISIPESVVTVDSTTFNNSESKKISKSMNTNVDNQNQPQATENGANNDITTIFGVTLKKGTKTRQTSEEEMRKRRSEMINRPENNFKETLKTAKKEDEENIK